MLGGIVKIVGAEEGSKEMDGDKVGVEVGALGERDGVLEGEEVGAADGYKYTSVPLD